MSLLPIRIYPDPVLREKCRPAGAPDERLRALAAGMIETLHAAPGAGLAAPQVGEPVRLVVVDLSIGKDPNELHVLFDPEVENGEGEQFEEEGCLSLPDVKERVRRFMRVRVRARNLEGREIVLDVEGVLSRVLQHEIDHLDGKLILDYMNRTKREAVKKRLRRRARSAPSS